MQTKASVYVVYRSGMSKKQSTCWKVEGNEVM